MYESINYSTISDFIESEIGKPTFANKSFAFWKKHITVYSSQKEVRIFAKNFKKEFTDSLIKLGEDRGYSIVLLEDIFEYGFVPVNISFGSGDVYSQYLQYFNEPEDLDGVLHMTDKDGFKHQLIYGDAKRGAILSINTLVDKSNKNRKQYKKKRKLNLTSVIQQS